MASDDFEALGWETIRLHLKEDDAFGFRWMSPHQEKVIEAEFSDQNANCFSWGGYEADLAEERAEVKTLCDVPPQSGFTLRRAKREKLKATQFFLSENGIVPLSMALMGGQVVPALTNIIETDDNKIVAAGFVGMLQNQFSKLADCAWMGLIATDQSCRGQGLGVKISASLIRDAKVSLNAKWIVGFAAPDNVASAGMLQRVGMRARDRVSCVVTVKSERFTR